MQLLRKVMRGIDDQTETLFAYVSPETFVPKNHPLRAIRKMADDALVGMDKLFDSMYATTGRDSIPPEKLLKAQLLMILYSIRSNRQLVEQIHYNFLYRWFLGLGLDEKVWDHSSFTKNNDRLTGSDVAAEFLLGYSNRQRRSTCCPASTSPLTGLSLKLGHPSRVSSPRTGRQQPAAAKTAKSISRDINSRTTLTHLLPILTPGCIAKARPRKLNFATKGIP